MIPKRHRFSATTANGSENDDLTTRVLVEAAKRASGVEHFVLISVIGADTVPIGYFRRKAAAKRIVSECGIPFSILQAALFHDLTLTAAKAMAKAPMLLLPGGVCWQSVELRDVACRLGELAGRVSNLAGPCVYTLEQLQRDCLRGRQAPAAPAIPHEDPARFRRSWPRSLFSPVIRP